MYKNVIHQKEQQRFVINKGGLTAYMSYEFVADSVLDYNHTIVPPDLGGQGIGTVLVQFALAYARVNHLSVVPSCSFVAHYISKHDGEQDLLVK